MRFAFFRHFCSIFIVKPHCYLSILSICLPLLANAAPEIGDNLETALAKMGKLIGTIELREKTLLLYPEGEVVLRQDTVVEVDLMSDAEFAAEQERLKAEREEWAIEQARRKEAHLEEGQSILADKRGSSAFASLPAKDRVDYWRGFQIRYPGVDASEDLARALESYETELAELKSQQRIAKLEARVAEAEQEAATARLETEKLKQETERTRQSTRYGLRYYYDPVVQPRYIYRPPTVTIFSNGDCVKTNTQRPNYWKFQNYNSYGMAERVAHILHGNK